MTGRSTRKNRIAPVSTSTIWTGMPASICIGRSRRASPRTGAPRAGCRPGATGRGGRRRWRRSRRSCRSVAGSVGEAQEPDRTRQPGERAEKGHREDDQERGPHAGVAGGVRVGADGPDLEAERGPVQQPASTRATASRAKTMPMWPLRPRRIGQRGVADVEVVGDADPGPSAARSRAPSRYAIATKLSMIVVTTSWAP